MGKRDLSAVRLLIPKCTAIHTCFMRGPIDVLFLDQEHRVLAVSPTLKPWRVRAGPVGTVDVLELPAGYTLEHGIRPGDVIECQLG